MVEQAEEQSQISSSIASKSSPSRASRAAASSFATRRSGNQAMPSPSRVSALIASSPNVPSLALPERITPMASLPPNRRPRPTQLTMDVKIESSRYAPTRRHALLEATEDPEAALCDGPQALYADHDDAPGLGLIGFVLILGAIGFGVREVLRRRRV